MLNANWKKMVILIITGLIWIGQTIIPEDVHAQPIVYDPSNLTGTESIRVTVQVSMIRYILKE